MGCTFCTSGTGEKCDGPLSTDEVEASCGCQCHECDACGSAYCDAVGGDETCSAEEDQDLSGGGDDGPASTAAETPEASVGPRRSIGGGWRPEKTLESYCKPAAPRNL